MTIGVLKSQKRRSIEDFRRAKRWGWCNEWAINYAAGEYLHYGTPVSPTWMRKRLIEWGALCPKNRSKSGAADSGSKHVVEVEALSILRGKPES